MAKRITPEDQTAASKTPREALADFSDQNPAGLPDDAEPADSAVEQPRVIVTGGSSPLADRKHGLGSWWKVLVRDMKMPEAVNPLPVRIGGAFYKMIRTNRETALPEAAIKMLRQGPVVSSKIRVRPSSPLYGKDDAAMRANEGCSVIWEKGSMFLIRRRPRFAVEKIEQLAAPPSGRAGVEL